MTTIIVIGKPGSGKSEFVKEYIRNRSCLVDDVQNEYGKKTKYPNQVALNLSDNLKDIRSRYVGSFKGFVSEVKKRTNSVIVFEEATAFLEGKIGEEVRTIMINKMHTGNVYIFVFHSISSVPPRILQLSDYVVLHDINDEQYMVEKKYPSLLDSYLEIKKLNKNQANRLKTDKPIYVIKKL